MKKLSFVAAIVLVLALTAGLGLLAGRRTVVGPIRAQLESNRVNTLAGGMSLADATPEEERAARSACFLDGAQVAARFAEFAWAPPAVPTPYVGFGPRPGRHLNAFITPLQLRAERDPVVPKPAGRTRVFVVGGSVAFGSGAPSQDRTVGGYLERVLRDPGVEVFTLAYPWWTSTHERIAIEQRVASLEPDLVLVLSGANDIAAALRGEDVRWMRTPVDRFFFERLSEDYSLAGAPPLLDVAPSGRSAPPPEQVAARVKANVLLAAQAVPGRLRYLLQPCLSGTRKPLTAREKAILAGNPDAAPYFDRCLDAIRDALAGTGLLTDLGDVFDGTAEDVFLDFVHVADRGNERIARRIAERR